MSAEEPEIYHYPPRSEAEIELSQELYWFTSLMGKDRDWDAGVEVFDVDTLPDELTDQMDLDEEQTQVGIQRIGEREDHSIVDWNVGTGIEITAVGRFRYYSDEEGEPLNEVEPFSFSMRIPSSKGVLEFEATVPAGPDGMPESWPRSETEKRGPSIKFNHTAIEDQEAVTTDEIIDEVIMDNRPEIGDMLSTLKPILRPQERERIDDEWMRLTDEDMVALRAAIEPNS